MRTHSRLPRLLLPFLLPVVLAACSSLKPRSPLMERVGQSDMSVDELRVRVRDMARRFPGVLEATADEAAGLPGSAGTREAMLRFKSNAVPVMQASLLQPDPVAALIDAWALLAQLQQALPENAPEEVKALFQRSLGGLEAEVETLWRELSGREDVSNLRRTVHLWAAKHPLTGPLVMRESTVPLLADFTDRSGVGLLGATAAALQDTQDLIARADLYAGSLPRQARWQAQLAAQEMLGMEVPALAPVLEEMERAVDVLVRVGALAGNTPALVEREREALQGFVSSERQAVLDVLHAERVDTLERMDSLGRGWVDQAFDRARGLVNQVFLWLLGLTLLLVLGLLGAVALLTRAARRGGGLPWGRSRGGGGPRGDTAPAVPPGDHGQPGEHPDAPHH